jgi:hypothetical protein
MFTATVPPAAAGLCGTVRCVFVIMSIRTPPIAPRWCRTGAQSPKVLADGTGSWLLTHLQAQVQRRDHALFPPLIAAHQQLTVGCCHCACAARRLPAIAVGPCAGTWNVECTSTSVSSAAAITGNGVAVLLPASLSVEGFRYREVVPPSLLRGIVRSIICHIAMG